MHEFQPYNRSWLLGLIKQHFNIEIYDIYLDDALYSKYNIEQLDPSVTRVVYVDDEMIGGADYRVIDAAFKHIKENSIFIFKMEEVAETFKRWGYKSILYPFFHIVDELIPISNFDPIVGNSSTVPFAVLNNRFTRERLEMLQILNGHNLLDKGFVTAVDEQFRHYFDAEVFSKIQSTSMDHYRGSAEEGVGFERLSNSINGVLCSSNLVNFYYVAQNVPGNILIQVETCPSDWLKFTTEKTFIPMATRKMPMVFAHWDIIGMLRDEGFDVFDDIIDHRVEANEAIAANKELLRAPFEHDIQVRLDSNYDYLVGEWHKKQINNLLELINSNI